MKCSFERWVRVLPVFAALMGGAVTSHAVPIKPVSYNMTNGYGTAVGGEYNYWDGNYNGTVGTNTINGNTVLDGGQLTGGLGALTDGTIATKDWESGLDTVENFLGTGPYVGWTWGDPTITFNFASAVKIASMTFYVDNPALAHGGVAAPKSFTIAGADYLVDTANLATGPVPISFSSLGLDTQNLTVTINRNISDTSFWIFLSEVTFDDGMPTPVPEPSSLLLFGAGLAGAALLWKRRTV
jgi:hypothetical protein